MQKLTEKKVKELLKETGHALRIEDYDDVEALDRLAEKVCGTTKSEARLLSEPFELCGLLFYPLTIAKSMWFSEKCLEWELEGVQQEALLFWLLSTPNETEYLNAYSERVKTNKAVKRLSRKLHCTPKEMTEVYHKCVGLDMNGDGDPNPQYGGLIECLLREYGGDPDRWLYETPLTMIETLMNKYGDRINAEQEAAAKKSGAAGKAVAPVATERLKALKNFREKAVEIAEKWSQDGKAQDS